MTIESRIKELKDIEKEKELKEESKELRITKRSGIEGGEYGDIYKVTLPVTFYFNKDGTYDGLAFDTEDITEDEARLIEELLDKLADAEDMIITDEFNDE